MDDPESLYGLYIRKAAPAVLFDHRPPHQAPPPPQWFVFGTGALIYDIYPGTVTVDDCYKASPYANFFFSVPGVPAELLQPLLAALNSKAGGTGEHSSRAALSASRSAVPTRLWPPSRLPAYVATTPTGGDGSYEVIYCDFDRTAVEAGLAGLGHGSVVANRSVFKPGFNDSSVLLEYFRTAGTG